MRCICGRGVGCPSRRHRAARASTDGACRSHMNDTHPERVKLLFSNSLAPAERQKKHSPMPPLSRVVIALGAPVPRGRRHGRLADHRAMGRHRRGGPRTYRTQRRSAITSCRHDLAPRSATFPNRALSRHPPYAGRACVVARHSIPWIASATGSAIRASEALARIRSPKPAHKRKQPNACEDGPRDRAAGPASRHYAPHRY